MMAAVRPRDRVLFLALAVLLALDPVQAAPPIKLALDAEKTSVWVGMTANISVGLLDAANKPSPADDALSVIISIKQPTGAVLKNEVRFGPGDTGQTFGVPIDTPGIYELNAQHPQLREAGLLLNAWRRSVERLAAPRAPESSRGPAGDVDVIDLLRPPRLELRFAPRRKFLADGKDSATVFALLTGEFASTSDLQVRLLNDSGRLEPRTLTIPKGEFSAEAQLTSNSVGTAKVEFLGAAPPAQLAGDRELQIQFGPPVVAIEVKPSPPDLTLIDRAELVVRLLSAAGVPIATDEPRPISLTLERGRGQLDEQRLLIPAGSAESRTVFHPSDVGEIIVAAASPNLMTVTTRLQVTWPLLPLLASSLGGLAGGTLAYLHQRRARLWRIGIGVITGFLLYWGTLFGAIEFLPRGALLNVLSAFAISAIGGWLGAKVFNAVFGRLGS